MFQKTDRGAPLHTCLRGGQRTPIEDANACGCGYESAAILRNIRPHHHCTRNDSMPRETNSRTSNTDMHYPSPQACTPWAKLGIANRARRVRRLLESGTQQVPVPCPLLLRVGKSSLKRRPVDVAIAETSSRTSCPLAPPDRRLAIPAGRYTAQRPFIFFLILHFPQPRAGSGAARTPQPLVRLSYIWARAANLGQRW